MKSKKTIEAKPEDSAAQIPSVAPCYILSVSYGNDSIALIQWANSGRGQYVHGQGKLWNYRGELCGSGMCGT